MSVRTRLWLSLGWVVVVGGALIWFTWPLIPLLAVAAGFISGTIKALDIISEELL